MSFVKNSKFQSPLRLQLLWAPTFLHSSIFFFFFWNSFFKFITIKIYYTIIQSLNQTHSYKKSIFKKKKNPLLLINTCYKRDSQVCKIHTNVHKPNWVLTTNSLVGGFGPTTIWLRMDGIWHVYFCHNAWIIWVYLTLFC